MVRPFRYSDIFLVQRLSRHAAKLNIVQATLHRQLAVGASLSAILPWNHGKVTTYILSQHGNRLAKAGYLQVSKRPGRPELDIVELAPGLDARRGHPAIWEKLLTFYMSGSAKKTIERIYTDVADQPLPVATFAHAGYRVYDRQSVWRLNPQGMEDYSGAISAYFRPQMAKDVWPLKQLYRRNVPREVQLAEGYREEEGCQPPILSWWSGGNCSNYVLEASGEVRGCIQIAHGARGTWIQPWFDFTDPDCTVANELIRFAVTALGRSSSRLPVYVAVREYHGALGTLISDYNFAPVTDRAMMVKHVRQWVRDAQPAGARVIEHAPTVPTVPFEVPRMNATDEAVPGLSRAVYRYGRRQEWMPENTASTCVCAEYEQQLATVA